MEEGQAVETDWPGASSVAIGTQQAEKLFPTQAHTRRGSPARTACTHAPLEQRFAAAGSLRFNAEDKHLPEEIGWPVVFLTSGQKLTLRKVMLYDEDGVQEAAKLRAQAASGVFVDFAQVTNNQSPHPSVWSASVECKKRWENGSVWRRHVHNGDEFVNVETELGAMSIRWDQVARTFHRSNLPRSCL